VLKMILPWKSGGKLTVGTNQKILTSDVVELQTRKGEIVIFNP
jgi:hypothetical protein